MAKKHYKAPLHQTGTVITTKTHFGSTSDMIVDVSNYVCEAQINDDEVVCKDDKGFYITKKSRINNGLADANRFDNIKSRISLIEKNS